MASKFYRDMKAIADELLTEFGYSINVIDANRSVIGTFMGLKSNITNDDAPASVIEQSDFTVFLTSGPEDVNITTRNFVELDGIVYTIVYVAPVKPTDLNLLYKLYVKGNKVTK